MRQILLLTLSLFKLPKKDSATALSQQFPQRLMLGFSWWVAGWIIGWVVTYMSFVIPAERLHETKTLVAFHHPRPSYDTHILILPRRVRRDVTALTDADADFMVDLFSINEPDMAADRDITAREVLDAGAQKLDEGLEDQPRVRARLLQTVGRVYDRLGDYDTAERYLEEGIADDLRFWREGVHVDGLRMGPVEVDSSWPQWIVDGHAPDSWYRPRSI